jgi:ATP/maltotriose-dependent transcriptional regulator MalT
MDENEAGSAALDRHGPLGQRLGTKAGTVKTHAVAIYGKLGASSRSEAVELAVSAGLLERFPT